MCRCVWVFCGRARNGQKHAIHNSHPSGYQCCPQFPSLQPSTPSTIPIPSAINTIHTSHPFNHQCHPQLPSLRLSMLSTIPIPSAINTIHTSHLYSHQHHPQLPPLQPSTPSTHPIPSAINAIHPSGYQCCPQLPSHSPITRKLAVLCFLTNAHPPLCE